MRCCTNATTFIASGANKRRSDWKNRYTSGGMKKSLLYCCFCEYSRALWSCHLWALTVILSLKHTHTCSEIYQFQIVFMCLFHLFRLYHSCSHANEPNESVCDFDLSQPPIPRSPTMNYSKNCHYSTKNQPHSVSPIRIGSLSRFRHGELVGRWLIKTSWMLLIEQILLHINVA